MQEPFENAVDQQNVRYPRYNKLTRSSVICEEPNGDIVPWRTSTDNVPLYGVLEVVYVASSNSDTGECVLQNYESKDE